MGVRRAMTVMNIAVMAVAMFVLIAVPVFMRVAMRLSAVFMDMLVNMGAPLDFCFALTAATDCTHGVSPDLIRQPPDTTALFYRDFRHRRQFPIRHQFVTVQRYPCLG